MYRQGSVGQHCVTCILFQNADLNLIDWSSQNFLAVALDNSVYLWNCTSGEIIHLLQMEHPDDYVSSVSWVKEGNYLAVGTSNAEVQVSAAEPEGLSKGCWSCGGVEHRLG